MPLGDPKHQLIYNELVNALGEAYVHHDPAVVECYRREAQSPPISTPMNAEFIVFPGSTRDVQAIVKLANRYLFPYSVSTTGTLGAGSAALKAYWVWIDLKRMNSLEIDSKNMVAHLQPYVTHAQLSAEARKVGLFNGAPSAGAQTSALVNTILFGMQTAAYRTGRATRNLLGAEMVLPNGDILRTGSLAMGGDNFWGEGPGPDLRGIVRGGHIGHQGSMGVVTRIALKLYPWSGPAVLPTEGAAPRKRVVMPDDRFRWHLIRYPKVHDGVRAMEEISKAEIGSVMAMFGPWNMAHHICKSREEHHQLEQADYFHKYFRFVVLVGVWGTTSKRQFDYEEKVLAEIVAETGGVPVEQEVFDAWAPFVAWRNLIDPLASRTQRPVPMVQPANSIGGGVYDALSACDWLIPQDPPDITLWIIPIDFAHCAMITYMSEPVFGEKTPEQEKEMMANFMARARMSAEKQIADSGTIGGAPHMVAPRFNSKIYLVDYRLKKAWDPLNTANPTRVLNLEALEALAKKDGVV